MMSFSSPVSRCQLPHRMRRFGTAARDESGPTSPDFKPWQHLQARLIAGAAGSSGEQRRTDRRILGPSSSLWTVKDPSDVHHPSKVTGFTQSEPAARPAVVGGRG